MKFILTLLTLMVWARASQALCVTSATANLRSGPGSKYRVTWVVSKYTPLIQIKRVGSWYQVEDMDGEEHWVYGKNVTSRMVCVAVKVPVAKLRKSFGAKGELADIRQVDRYTSFKRLDAKEEWYEVEASWGETYWIHESTVWRPVKISRLNY